MKTCLICSDCGVSFDSKEIIYRMKIDDSFHYYHISCGEVQNFVKRGGIVVVALASYFHKVLQLTEKLKTPKQQGVCRKWTAQEKQFIMDNPNIHVRELAKIMGIPENLIYSQRYNAGVRNR
jgi:hypothetical protein